MPALHRLLKRVTAHTPLDIAKRDRQKQELVFPTTDSFYAQWRRQNGIISLHENSDPPPERLLQAIWLHQRLLRQRLETLDGRTVAVLHPGFPNREGGPDFRGAVLQFGDDAPVSGDVEVDL